MLSAVHEWRMTEGCRQSVHCDRGTVIETALWVKSVTSGNLLQCSMDMLLCLPRALCCSGIILFEAMVGWTFIRPMFGCLYNRLDMCIQCAW